VAEERKDAAELDVAERWPQWWEVK